MRNRGGASLFAVAGLGAAVSAQVITSPGITARLDLTWQEDALFPHNDNGFLEPGEHALMLMSLSFTGQFTVASFSPAIGGFMSGTILGLGSAFIHIRSSSPDPSGLYNGGITQPTSSSIGPNASNEGTSGYGVRGGWRLGGNVANGYIAPNGFQLIGPAQLPVSPSAAITANPIDSLVRLGWQPNSYSDRTVSFQVQRVQSAGSFVGLYFQLDSMLGGAAYLGDNQTIYGSVNIPIRSIPTPPALVPIIVAAALSAGRGRRGRSADTRRETRL